MFTKCRKNKEKDEVRLEGKQGPSGVQRGPPSIPLKKIRGCSISGWKQTASRTTSFRSARVSAWISSYLTILGSGTADE